MIDLRIEQEPFRNVAYDEQLSLVLHPTFHVVYERLKKWLARFPLSVDHSVFNDLTLLYLLSGKKYLDHRTPAHLFRLVMSIHLMQKKLLKQATFSPNLRHLEVRLLSTNLMFPFAHKPVLGCLIGFNLLDRYEVFDEENIVLALQKFLPQLRLVSESSYCHTSQHKNLKIFYFEIEQKNKELFSLLEQSLLKNNLEEKVKKSIQTLSPTIFMAANNEEIYKNILVLSQELRSLQDLPQAYITFDQQTGKEIVFRVQLVHISPFQRFNLKEHFNNANFVSEKVLTVGHIEEHPIQAHIFRMHFPRDPSFLRADGSLDFYSARQNVVAMVFNAIGEFRDYNGGILIKQQELLDKFKDHFPEFSEKGTEFLEAFFYALTPMEKQATICPEILNQLFSYFLENQREKLPSDSIYSFKIFHSENHTFLIVHGSHHTLSDTISKVMQQQDFSPYDIAYNIIDTAEGVFFNCVLLNSTSTESESLIHIIQDTLQTWHEEMKARHILRVGLEYTPVSLDPRIGGETVSGILKLLFEGLTRMDQTGTIENGIAESIAISDDFKHYTFKLRRTFWNDGSPLTAYDFEYAWKKILSPDFKTAFAHPFYPIKNAKEAKEGNVSVEEVGIHVINDLTIEIDLIRPTPYFLQWTAHPVYSPIHRHIDQQRPQWPYQCEKNFPCNGPFELKINKPTQGFQLVKNNAYWDSDKAQIDQIALTPVTPGQALQAFQKKEIDWIGNPFGGWHSTYTSQEEDLVYTSPYAYVCCSVFNTAYLPFNNIKIRQAFAYAIDRSKITENAFFKIKPAFSVFLSHEQNQATPFPDGNIEKARRLLDEGLRELNMSKKDLAPLSIAFLEKGIREHAATCLKEQITENLGIECQLDPQPWKTLFNNLTESRFQLGIIHWSSWVNDPSYTLGFFKTSKNPINLPKWEHTKYQQLLDLSENEVNLEKRLFYLRKAEEILNQEMPLIPLFYQPHKAMVRKEVEGVFGAKFKSIFKTFF